jgi:hypothetical protein
VKTYKYLIVLTCVFLTIACSKKEDKPAVAAPVQPPSPVAEAPKNKEPKEAKPEIKQAIDKINKIMSTSIYKEKDSQETSKYSVEYVGECNLYVYQEYVPKRESDSKLRTDVNLKNIQPIMSDEWNVQIKSLTDKEPFEVVYDNNRLSKSDDVTLWHAASKKTSKELVQALETIVSSDKCQPVTIGKNFKPKFDVESEIVGDASVKFKVTTNIPGKVEVMMSYKLDKAIDNYGKDYSDGHLTIENGKGEITLSGVGSGSKGTLYHKISPGRYVGELFFKPSWGLVDDVAKASKVNKDIKIVVPIKGRLKGQKEKFIPA